MTVLYVTAIYTLYTHGYADEVWSRVRELQNEIPVYLFCSAEDLPKTRDMHNVRPIVKEFHTLDTYSVLQSTTRLPAIRNPAKDTKEFFILMNAKTEFLNIVRNIETADHYVWIDAGISKIFKNPKASFSDIRALMAHPNLRHDTVFMSGCWRYYNRPYTLLSAISWRFCGGFLVVPRALTEQVHTAVLEACTEFRDIAGIAIWETNIWAYLENRLPIQWEYGDHNEMIYGGLTRYITS